MAKPIPRGLEAELDEFVNKPTMTSAQNKVSLATTFLRETNEPTDMLHVLVAIKALDDLWEYYKEE